MKVKKNEYSSNSAKEHFARTGCERKINSDLCVSLGADPREMVELAKGITADEFLDALPFQDTRSDWEEAAKEAWVDIQAAITDNDRRNEWQAFTGKGIDWAKVKKHMEDFGLTRYENAKHYANQNPEVVDVWQELDDEEKKTLEQLFFEVRGIPETESFLREMATIAADNGVFAKANEALVMTMIFKALAKANREHSVSTLLAAANDWISKAVGPDRCEKEIWEIVDKFSEMLEECYQSNIDRLKMDEDILTRAYRTYLFEAVDKSDPEDLSAEEFLFGGTTACPEGFNDFSFGSACFASFDLFKDTVTILVRDFGWNSFDRKVLEIEKSTQTFEVPDDETLKKWYSECLAGESSARKDFGWEESSKKRCFRLVINYENNAEKFWDAVHKSDSLPPAIAEWLGGAEDSHDVTDEERDAFLKVVRDFPEWTEENSPILIQSVQP